MEPSSGVDRKNADEGCTPHGAPDKGAATDHGGRAIDTGKGERRESVRLYYPRGASPKVLNANFRIVNISREAISFVCQDDCGQCTRPINLKSVLDLRIEFHDGETLDVKVKILRCQRDMNWDEKHYAGAIEGAISAERIGKEQAYLLRHYPDFCRFARAKSEAYVGTPLYY